MTSAHLAARRLDDQQRPPLPHVTSEPVSVYTAPYLTPSHSKDQMSMDYASQGPPAPSTKAVDIAPRRQPQQSNINPQWPTPPYDENDWAAAAAASIFATQRAYQ
jgi:meiosis induction protein kinase IME2/SME1